MNEIFFGIQDIASQNLNDKIDDLSQANLFLNFGQ